MGDDDDNDEDDNDEDDNGMTQMRITRSVLIGYRNIGRQPSSQNDRQRVALLYDKFLENHFYSFTSDLMFL